ncbi:hypothetical protein CEXT_783911 [Caerostris extrusa]|uniref:Uncharacterized protein n=1 Tax=Caerostris extrusa TaxID=172846 RepID=A0AAV4W5I8_CAEEX|nr:hypothetical protein CEXT_783911 [Caerostris extrusa]
MSSSVFCSGFRHLSPIPDISNFSKGICRFAKGWPWAASLYDSIIAETVPTFLWLFGRGVLAGKTVAREEEGCDGNGELVSLLER